MTVIAGIGLGVLTSVFISLLVADVRSWILRGSRVLVLVAAQILPEQHRARYAEEWQGNLIAIGDSPLSVLALALWTTVRAPKWATQLRHADEGVDEADDEMVSVVPPRKSSGVNPAYTFERFVASNDNRLAHRAAMGVAEAPSEAYNPLFLHGAPGLGKTHLLVAITNYLSDNAPDLNIRYTTAESFTNEFVAALRTTGSEAFKRRYRDIDVLLIDDVQFLEGKPATEEEFFHTFNALYESGSQLVLSADRIPSELSTLASRLRDRFEWGLTVAVERPDFDTRVAILHRLVEEAGIEIVDHNALPELASRIDANVRQLHGGLTRVIAHASLLNRPLSSELIAEVVPRPSRVSTITSVEEIQQQIAEHFGVSRAELIGPSRAAVPLRARQVAIYLTRELTELSLPQIGRLHGGRDHTTVLNSLRRIEASLDGSPDLADTIMSLRQRLSA